MAASVEHGKASPRKRAVNGRIQAEVTGGAATMPHRMDTDRLIDSMPGASDALRALARRGTVRRYARGRLLIEEGDVGDTLYIILDGRLRAFAANDEGREITFNELRAGDYVGEMSLDGGPRSASVEVEEPALCAVVTRRTLEAFVHERPEFAFELLSKVIRVARAATETARAMALDDVYGRVRLLLESSSDPQPDGTRRLRHRLTHAQIAQRTGCSRSMVSRVMKSLERGGCFAKPDRLLRPLPLRY
ncbi:MAG: Crp/Fnr family transcriptional regulator [Rubrivivax sp.]